MDLRFIQSVDPVAFLLTQSMTAAGIGFLVAAWLGIRKSRIERTRRSVHTKGVVQDNLHLRTETGFGADRHVSTAWYPVVEIMLPNRQMMTLRSHYGTGSVKYHVGSSVDVWYNPSDPSDFHMDNHKPFAGFPTRILAVLGLCFVAFGLAFGYLVLTGQVG